MFRTAGGNTMKYDCSFVVCRTPCDGSSCKSKSTRKKRDTYAVREPHYSETIYIPKDKVLEAKPYLEWRYFTGFRNTGLEQQMVILKVKCLVKK
ncbi:Hypothetical predicted protein [Mytilus galloprovincialis]|uniref:ZP domain-containing protein n=1 Tax=Mytilus galloprovincialis TaxID=29158 RepID=A0A8B6F315_MYTGA|nr:Hypothetical predicted protein [Mytilus galloprovincialis]